MWKIVGFLVLLAVGVGVLYFVPVSKESGPRTYVSDVYSISFSYPVKYLIVETDQPSGERIQHSIVLIEDTPENRALLAGERSGTEGPPTITITLFQNNLDNYTLEGFVDGTNFSNFKLSDGTRTEEIVGGEPALRYRATGLYENENVVVARPAYVYMFTAFFHSPTDQILADFEDILKTVQFEAGRTPTSADNAPPGSIHNLPVPYAVAAVRTHVAISMGIDEGLVIIMTAYEKEWSDACLGLAGSDEMCAQVITPGWEVSAQANGTLTTYRTNADGSVIRQEQ